MSSRCTVGVRQSWPSLLTTCLISALALAGCVSTEGKLDSSAHKLEHNAYVIARDSLDSNYGSDDQGLAHRAQSLSDDTRRFRDTLLNKGPGNPGVKAAFERVSQRYQALRETVDRSDSHEAHREMREVTDAYVDVQHEMGG